MYIVNQGSTYDGEAKLYNQGVKMRLTKIKVTEVHQQENSRVEDFDYSELMESIRESGLVQPIVVSRNFYTKTGKPYVLVAGNRRFAACIKLGYTRIEAVVNTRIKNEADLLIFNMTENLQRRDVSAFEQGRLVKILIDKHNLTSKECATRLGLPIKRVQLMLMAFSDIPEKFAKRVVLGSAARQKGVIPLIVAKEVALLRKSAIINKAEASEILTNVLDGVYHSSHVADMTTKLRQGNSYQGIKGGIKNVSYVSFRIPILQTEREMVDGSLTDFMEQLIYGECKDNFTRPRFK